MRCYPLPESGCLVIVEIAGPGPSYIEAGGEKHMYTKKTARYLAHNAVFFARLLKDHPIPTNLNALIAEAQAESADICPSMGSIALMSFSNALAANADRLGLPPRRAPGTAR